MRVCGDKGEGEGSVGGKDRKMCDWLGGGEATQIISKMAQAEWPTGG